MGHWGTGKWGVAVWGPDASDLFLNNYPAGPLRRDYRVALAATTRPAFVPLAPTKIAPVKLPWDGRWSPDYRVALLPGITQVRSAVTIITGDDGGTPLSRRKPGYWSALIQTTYPVRPLNLPTPTPATLAAVITPDPLRANYSRVLESTTHPVGQLVGAFAFFGTPSTWFFPPTPPMPGVRDYRQAVAATTLPRMPELRPSFSLTPTRWFASPLDPLPRVRDYRVALFSTTTTFFPPEPPPPGPPVCIVTFQDDSGQAVVTLSPQGVPAPVALAASAVPIGAVLVPAGAAVPVSLTPATAPTPVPFGANPKCP